MLTVGNTEGFNRLTTTFKPKTITIRWIRSGLTVVDLGFIGLTLTTLGPWQVMLCSTLNDGTFNSAIVRKLSDGIVSHICECWDAKLAEEHGGTFESNARLISTAPEMARLLREVVLWHESGINDGKPDGKLIALICEVLAKHCAMVKGNP